MAKKKPAAKKSGSEPLFVKSKVREFIKGKDCNTSSGVLDGDSLNSIIMTMLDKAVKRAKDNGRKTVKARDL
ncbi:MAG: hypothetical protein ACFFAO_21185 [Candidatus Hermodarchaeota archaeon]